MMIRVATSVTARVGLAVAFHAKQRIEESKNLAPSFDNPSQHHHAGFLDPFTTFFHPLPDFVGFIDQAFSLVCRPESDILGFSAPLPRPSISPWTTQL
jgi:hypothetical protein